MKKWIPGYLYIAEIAINGLSFGCCSSVLIAEYFFAKIALLNTLDIIQRRIKMINLNKKYKLVDRDHTYEVELFTIKNGLVFGIQSTLIPDKWISLTCEAELGYVIDKGHTQFRLVEIGPYDHIQVDDPCYFWNEPPQFACPNKIPGHFAGICSNTGRPLMWKDGTTSFTQHGFSKVPMDNCVLNDELGFVIDGRSKGMSY